MVPAGPRFALLLLCGGLVATGCARPTGPPADPNYVGYQEELARSRNASILGDSSLILGNSKARSQEGGGALGVNAYLWRGALDTLSFMPLQSADPFGGVIITDWYTPVAANGERFKATAYILGRELRSDGVRVSIFRQVLDRGQWVDAPISPVTVGEIENKVLSRARELREQSQASN